MAVQTRLEAKKKTDEVEQKVEVMWCSRKKLIEYQESYDSLQSIRDMTKNGPHKGESYFIFSWPCIRKWSNCTNGVTSTFHVPYTKKKVRSFLGLIDLTSNKTPNKIKWTTIYIAH